MCEDLGSKEQGMGSSIDRVAWHFTAEGDLVICDCGNNRVQVLRKDGTFVRVFGSKGHGEGMFNHPYGVFVQRDGSFVVVDSGNNERVQVFDSGGGFVRSIGFAGANGPSHFQRMRTRQYQTKYVVAVGGGGEIVVSNQTLNDVQVFSREGALLQTIRDEGDSRVDFLGVQGVAVDGKGRVFVSDMGRVVMLS
jgi:DNA-binding beta-propeller fold protein YncE